MFSSTIGIPYLGGRESPAHCATGPFVVSLL